MTAVAETKPRMLDRDYPRIDGVEKVTGEAVFSPDVRLPGMLHGCVLHSPLPHARIVSIDVSRAKALPGVYAVLTGEDVPVVFGQFIQDQPVLASGVVRFVGEPVAAVVAESGRTAEKAVSLIDVCYKELPFVTDPARAMERGAPLVHEGLSEYKMDAEVKAVPKTNFCNTVLLEKGDVEDGMSKSAKVYEDTFSVPSVAHAALQLYCTVANVDAEGRVTLWTDSDSPYRLRTVLSRAFNLDPSQVRVVVPYVGGGFGGRNIKLDGIAIALARAVPGRPVRLEYTREESLASTSVSNSAMVTVKTGVSEEGVMLARDVKIVMDAGAYAEKGPHVLTQGARGAAGPYRIPNVRIEGSLVYTNKVPGDAYRGFGFFQGLFGSESQIDMIAGDLGIDPLEMRLKNALVDGDVNPVGEPVVSCGVKECLEKAAEALDWWGTRERGVGLGIACGLKNTRTPTSSSVAVAVTSKGDVTLYTSLVEEGQGSKHALAKLAASELGVELSKVRVVTSDTSVTPWDASTTSSRTVFAEGNALLDGISRLVSQMKDLASARLGVRSSDVGFADGEFLVGGARTSTTDLLGKVLLPGQQIQSTGWYDSFALGPKDESAFWQYVAQGARVTVDGGTGKVALSKVVVAQDVGHAIDRTLTELQLVGGTVQGIGNTLYEELKFDDKGKVRNPNFVDYVIPTSMDAPGDVRPILVEVPHPAGPKGAKGAGEGSLLAIQAAIANAVFSATGIRFRSYPVTAEKIAMAIEGGSGDGVGPGGR